MSIGSTFLIGRYAKVAVLIFGSFSALCQSSDYYPNTFNAYFNNLAQITPAYVPEEGKLEFNGGYTSSIGAFKKVASYYATASRRLEGKKGNVHVIRLQFSNEKDGSYITSPRAYVNYALSLPLAEDLAMFAGFSVGMIGTYYSAPSTQNTTSTLPDGALGIGIKWRKLTLGGSCMQAFNSHSNPFVSTIVYHRYYNVYSQLEKEWPSGWTWKGYALYSYFPNWPQELNLATSLTYNRLVTLGTTYKYGKALSFFTTVLVHNGSDDLELSLNYNTPWSASLIFQNSLEICLKYALY